MLNQEQVNNYINKVPQFCRPSGEVIVICLSTFEAETEYELNKRLFKEVPKVITDDNRLKIESSLGSRTYMTLDQVTEVSQFTTFQLSKDFSSRGSLSEILAIRKKFAGKQRIG